MNRQMPHVICDIDGTPVTPEQAKQIITQHFTVPDEVRRRRRSSKTPGRKPRQVPTASWGKAPQQAAHGGMTVTRTWKGVDKRGDLRRR